MAGAGALLNPSAGGFKLPHFKYFKLNFPNAMEFAEAQEMMNQFWNMQEMDAIQRDFEKSGKIVFSKHQQSKYHVESLIGFSSEEAYQEWESVIAAKNCCDDDRLRQEGFKFTMNQFNMKSDEKQA